MRKKNGHGSCEIETPVINLTILQSKSAETFAVVIQKEFSCPDIRMDSMTSTS